MTTKEFIEKAIEGGWKPERRYKEGCQAFSDICGKKTDGFWDCKYCAKWNGQDREIDDTSNTFKIILDPKAWEAVGKVAWKEIRDCGQGIECWCDDHYDEEETIAQSHYKMHAMIDHLVESGTIESYLETL